MCDECPSEEGSLLSRRPVCQTTVSETVIPSLASLSLTRNNSQALLPCCHSLTLSLSLSLSLSFPFTFLPLALSLRLSLSLSSRLLSASIPFPPPLFLALALSRLSCTNVGFSKNAPSSEVN